MIEVHCGDITRLGVDAIVNAASQNLCNSDGIDGAILRLMEPALGQTRRLIGSCPVGEARATPGFGLPVKRIYHTVGPVWRGGNLGEPELLGACYHNCLVLARRESICSIAFPPISCGHYGYPPEQAAAIAVAQVQRALQRESSLRQVIFCCAEQKTAGLYLSRLRN